MRRLGGMKGSAGLCGFFSHIKFKEMNIKFYASEAKDNSIIAYGDTHPKTRRFKITYKNGRYLSYKKKSGKYWKIAESQSLNDAQQACIISIPA